MADRAFIASGTCDAENRLIRADEPLAGLQRRCGGTIPGPLAVPMLLDLVASARRTERKLAREIMAVDQDEKIVAWTEVQPDPVDGSCRIGLATWHTEPLAEEDLRETADRHFQIDRQCAELIAQLDASQNILAVQAQGPALTSLARTMAKGRGKPWTDFVQVEGSTHRQPLHWRLLDGAKLAIAGSDRSWKAALRPAGRGLPGDDGFELVLVADTPANQSVRVARAAPAVATEPVDEISVGRDLAGVLRRPINRIIANAETIRGRLAGPLPDEYSEYAADISHAGQHLLALIDDLADLEVVEAGDFRTAPDKIDLADVVRRAIGILGVRAQDKGITLVGPDAGETAPATGEFRRVLQVLLNLIGNAINYSPRGTSVRVFLGSDVGMASVTVGDEGPGMDDAQQARAFGKFERLGRSGDGGSGLGLYISRQLARAMGGDIALDTAPGEGARFTLLVPARR